MPSLLPAALTAGVILENGGTDAPNAVSACVASGALRPRAAVAMAAAGNLIGCLAAGLFFPFVAGTTAELSGMAALRDPFAALTAAMAAALVWTAAAWALSLPTSESHALLAALGGAALRAGAPPDPRAWTAVLAGAVGSVAAGWLAGAAAERLAARLFPGERPGAETALRRVQIALAAAAAFLHGAQDGQKFACVMALCGLAPGAAAALTAVLMAAGTALCGKRMLSVAGTLGIRGLRDGLAADAAGAAVLAAATAAGLPVSTTHVKSAAAAGAGRGPGRAFGRLALAWGLTFPACAALGWLFVPAVLTLARTAGM